MTNELEIIKRKAVQIFSEEELEKKINSGKKLTIKFGNKVLINEGILKSPSIVKLNFDEKKLVDISCIDIN